MAEEAINTVKANVGDTIQIKRGAKKGKKGEVTVLRDNSVIVELGVNKKTGEPIKTVVNHKNYKIVK
ncbi:YkvS family protein [Caldibacillus lycopersici]|uniref:YkvS family protein n=1 Tax=Perspicuibacillus lycopersici TaxID=1325689 RepID=A0AAE3IUU0_9BACI|nr:YkvS family protein [Perspicuibacillus lycopersici]MCU9614612.1 YkvS family protein [Perspicuibacillus lycopersici]